MSSALLFPPRFMAFAFLKRETLLRRTCMRVYIWPNGVNRGIIYNPNARVRSFLWKSLLPDELRDGRTRFVSLKQRNPTYI